MDVRVAKIDICVLMALEGVEPCADCLGTEWSEKKICQQGMQGYLPPIEAPKPEEDKS